MNRRGRIGRCLAAAAMLGVSAGPVLAGDILPDNDIIMRALVDEINRSMDLQMEDLEKPYFIEYTVEDSITYQLSASYGAVTGSDRDRSRRFFSRVRVGSYELDNTNFSGGGGGFFFGSFGGGGGGGQASLPIDDDYTAIRQAIWWATDQDYKDAVETLTKKRAYMEDKNLEDRPNDFSKAPVVEFLEPSAELNFDKTKWEGRLKQISGHFKPYDQIQDSNVRLFVGAGNSFVVNTEGTRVRTGDTGLLLAISAETQADDGMKLSDNLTYTGETTADLPPIPDILKDVDDMVANLTKAMNAPILESYTGPVLFDSLAAGQMFRKLLASGVAGHVDPVGTQRRRFQGAQSLEKKIGQRILPRSFQVYDDPTVKKFGDTLLFGHYRYDDEGVKAQRVDLVVNGVLKDMAMSRVPTKKLSGTNGHGRRNPGQGTAHASIACLFIQDDEGLSDAELKASLIQAAKEEGLEYALRIRSIRSAGIASSRSDVFAFFMQMQRGGGRPTLGDPIYAYKVYVNDGHEELVRGIEFGSVEVRSLKRILAASKNRTAYNYVGIGLSGATPPSTIVAPAVLFEELDLSKIEQEHDKLPILKAPSSRQAT